MASLLTPNRGKKFPISRDPPEGGTGNALAFGVWYPFRFPISRDPPEGGTVRARPRTSRSRRKFPISRDPPEGGTKYQVLVID